jgi:hypothetical protein
MSFKPHLGVFGLTLAARNANVSSPFGPGSPAWMFSDAAGSFVRYFREVSSGLIDIRGAEVFGPGVVTDTGVQAGIMKWRKEGAGQTACDFARTMNAGDLRRFDGLVFICRGEPVDAGADWVSVDEELIPAALLDDRGNHSQMAHEIGHVMGLEHSYRSSWYNPGGFYGEYGDAADLMSALTFGGLHSVFALPYDPASSVDPAAEFWASAGPGLSPAIIWRYLSTLASPPPWVRVIPADGSATRVVLRRPGATAAGQQMLAAMPDPDGDGWWTAEYRPALEWDGGLTFSPPDLGNAPGVVIHRIRSLGTAFEHPSLPRPDAVDYQATIPVPTGGDLDWSNGHFAVRVTSGDDDKAAVLAGRTLSQQRTVRIALSQDHDPENAWNRPDGVEEVPLTGPDCGPATWRLNRHNVALDVTAAVSTTGFTTPSYTFTVNGRGVNPPRHGPQPPQKGHVEFPALVWVPTGRLTGEQKQLTISANWDLAGGRLVLHLPARDGTYEVAVAVRVEEHGRPDWGQASQSTEVTTFSFELPSAGQQALERCLRRLVEQASELRVPVRRWPHPPEPIDGPDWTQIRGRALAEALTVLGGLERVNPYLARRLRAGVAAGLGMPAGELLRVAAELDERNSPP